MKISYDFLRTIEFLHENLKKCTYICIAATAETYDFNYKISKIINMEKDFKKRNHQVEGQLESNERVSFRMNEVKKALMEIRTARWRKREETNGAKRQKTSEETARQLSLPEPKVSAIDRDKSNQKLKIRKSVSYNTNGGVQEFHEKISRLNLLANSPALSKKVPSEIIERKKKKKKSARVRKKESKFLALRDNRGSSSDSD